MSDKEESGYARKRRGHSKKSVVISSSQQDKHEEEEEEFALPPQRRYVKAKRAKDEITPHESQAFDQDQDREKLEPIQGNFYFVDEPAGQRTEKRKEEREYEEERGASTEEDEMPASTEEDSRIVRVVKQKMRLERAEKGGFDWGATLLNLFVIVACLAAYGYYTYGALFIIPPVTYKPLYPMMITNDPYNTTSRFLNKLELDTETVRHKHGIVFVSSLLKTLKWYAKQKDYNVVCAHHLAHDLGIHPKICILHNKLTDQMYSMVNPRVTGGSEETQRIAQTSVALGPTRREFKRTIAVQVSYLSYPEKLHMYAQFVGPDAATLQLVIDEMEGKMN